MLDFVFQIALILVPAGAVFYTTKTFLNNQNQKDLQNLSIELKKQRQDFFLPSRMEAYQRLVLLMERISPNSLIMRTHKPHSNATQFQKELLETIRQEFEHNIAQQLFVSPEAWKLVQNSKEETVKIINLAGKQMTEESTGFDLSAKIFEIITEVGITPTEIAIDYIKKEFQQLLL